MHTEGKFSVKKMYINLNAEEPRVSWNCPFYCNKARPRAQMILWLVCHGKIDTKARLHGFGMVDNMQCCFCDKDDALNHLFFGCTKLRKIWQKVLDLIHFQHNPMEWKYEINWLILRGKGKGWKAALIKLPIT